MLPDLPLREVYDSSECDLVRDLQVPLLSQSANYLRGVGFFTSGWMRIASAGLEELVANGGSGRVVVSPILDPSDWQAMVLGQSAMADQILLNSLRSSVEDLADSLEKDTRNALAWMVAENLLQFKFAIERSNSAGDYHDKVGVFVDDAENVVAIHGSFNDSVKATFNGEAFSVFRSWVVGHQGFVRQHQNRLELLWEGGNAQFCTYSLPSAIRDEIITLRTSAEAPWKPRTMQHGVDISRASQENNSVALRSYQRDAISAWTKAGNRGILEMATGTGKTITALYAASELVEAEEICVIVILVPYLHLMEQWSEDARRFGFQPLCCSGEDSQWHRKLKSALGNLALGVTKALCVIAVHNTGASEKFLGSFSRVVGKEMLLIADEAHGLGASHLRRGLIPQAEKRLGLSATPRRWFDEEGTTALEAYFGGVCYQMPLESAIGVVLTPYTYHPIQIGLDIEERAEYVELSRQIGQLMSRSTSRNIDERLKSLLLRRTRILAAAKGKLPALISLLKDLITKKHSLGEEVRDILVYAPAGHHKEYLLALSKLGLRCHEFVHEVTLREREQLLKRFASGQVQVLVAIKCLDEGVDVPSTQTAFVLASSTNPREFVQRRGRILRKAEGKKEATIFDFLVVDAVGECDEATRSLLRREMPRFAEFASASKNEFEARSLVRPLLDRCEMLPLLDKKPWDIYKEAKETEWDFENAERQ